MKRASVLKQAMKEYSGAKSMEISRSEQKRRVKQVEQLVEEVAGLPAGIIAKIPVSGEVRELFLETVGMKGGARKRQVKYITKLLKNEPLEELYAFLSSRKGTAVEEKKAFHELEFYRDALLNEIIDQHREAEEGELEMNEERPSRVAAEIAGKLPGIDTQVLTSLAWLYARTRNRKYSREIFRQLRSAHVQQKIFFDKE